MTYPATLEYTVQIWEEDGQFIAHAMPLDVMSSGPTVEEARAALDEAVGLFLDTAAEAGTLAIIRNNLRTAGISREEYFDLLDEV
jgi:predicted RNase H-like HicB family nuclease